MLQLLQSSLGGKNDKSFYMKYTRVYTSVQRLFVLPLLLTVMCLC